MSLTGPAATLRGRATEFSRRRLCWLAFGGIVILSAILRLRDIGAVSIWLDEAISWHQASQSFADMIRLMTRDEHPPLFNSVLFIFIRAFGDSEAILRLPSALFGIAAVGAVFWVASMIDGRAAGLLAAVLLCFSSFHIYYSQEARPYALLSLSASLFVGCTMRALETDRRVWHAAASFTALCLLYSHAYGTLLWLSIAIATAAGTKAWRDPDRKILLRWAAWQAGAFVLFLPWVAILVWRYHLMIARGFWIPRPDGPFLLDIVEAVASGGAMTLALLAGTMFALVPQRLPGTAARMVRPKDNHHALHRAILLAWLLGPLAMALVISLITTPILMDRYLIGSLPAWLIFAAMGACRLYRMWGKWLLGAAIAGAAVNWWFYAPDNQEDARATVAAYVEQAQPDECVLVYRNMVSDEILYYLHKPPRCFLGPRTIAEIQPWTLTSRRVWLFFGFSEKSRSALVENLQAHGWQMREVRFEQDLSLELLEPVK